MHPTRPKMEIACILPSMREKDIITCSPSIPQLGSIYFTSSGTGTIKMPPKRAATRDKSVPGQDRLGTSSAGTNKGARNPLHETTMRRNAASSALVQGLETASFHYDDAWKNRASLIGTSTRTISFGMNFVLTKCAFPNTTKPLAANRSVPKVPTLTTSSPSAVLSQTN
jgi:hypothetical protein